MSNFQVSDGTLDLPCNHPRYDPLFKGRPFIEMMERSFLRSCKCDWDLSFDEGSMAWKGRVNFKCYNPAKWHLKLFEVSDAKTGFVIGFEVYTGKKTTQCAVNAQVLDPDCNQTTRVVIGLLDKARLLDKGHHVYMDNYYSSPCLYEELHFRSTFGCGTCRSNRKYLPKAVTKPKLKKKGDCVF